MSLFGIKLIDDYTVVGLSLGQQLGGRYRSQTFNTGNQIGCQIKFWTLKNESD